MGCWSAQAAVRLVGGSDPLQLPEPVPRQSRCSPPGTVQGIRWSLCPPAMSCARSACVLRVSSTHAPFLSLLALCECACRYRGKLLDETETHLVHSADNAKAVAAKAKEQYRQGNWNLCHTCIIVLSVFVIFTFMIVAIRVSLGGGWREAGRSGCGGFELPPVVLHSGNCVSPSKARQPRVSLSLWQ